MASLKAHRFIPLLLFVPLAVLSQESASLSYFPWFTGPLLAPTPINMDPKHPAIQPSITVFNTFGSYNSEWKFEKQDNIWAINPFVDFQFGITDYLGVEILASSISNFQRGQIATHFQDTAVLFGYQVSNDVKGSWIPDFRVLLQEIFPTGKYQKFNPKKLAIESTGAGSFQTGPVLAFRKLFYLTNHYLSLRGSVAYLFPSEAHVKGFNTYGGASNTRAKVRPGQSFIAFFSGEFSINQQWVLAFDSEFSYQKKSRFAGGKRGTLAPGVKAIVGLPSSAEISFAPEVEYNYSPKSGMLGGLWFTLAGKNTAAFGSAFLAWTHIF